MLIAIWSAVLGISLGIAYASYGWRGALEPVFSTDVGLGQDVETGFDTAATIYCTMDPPDVCKPGRKSKPEMTGAPIVVVLPGSAQPKENYAKISEMLAVRGFFVMVVEQLVGITVPDDPRIHFSNLSDVNLIPASVIPQALKWLKQEFAAGSSQMLPCATPDQDSVSLIGHALGARAAKSMLYLHQPANVIPLGTRKIEFTPQIKSLPYLPQIKGVFCYGLGEPQFAIDEYGRHAPPRSGVPFLVANGDLELADIDGGPVIVEDKFNHRDAYLILENMDHISIVDQALRENPLVMHDMPDDGRPGIVDEALRESPPAVHGLPDNGQAIISTPAGGLADHHRGSSRGSSRAGRRPSVRGRRQRRGRGLLRAAPPAGAMRAVSRRSTRQREEQMEIVSAVAVAAVRVMVCPARDTPAVPEVPGYVLDAFGDSADLRDQWLRWIQHP